jgi:hypothetical protein
LEIANCILERSAIARNIRLGGSRNIQFRIDMFNAPNSAIITGRNTTMNLSSPSDPVTATTLPYDANGNVIASRSLPRNAGFGVANTRIRAPFKCSFDSRSEPRKTRTNTD